MKRAATALLLAPALAVVGLVFALPMGLLFVVSFWSVARFKLTPTFSLAAWWRFLDNYGPVTLYTLAIGVAVATVCTVAAFAFAYALRFEFPGRADALLVATLVALFGGYLVKIYAWKSILSEDGLINRALIGLGFRETPLPWLIFNRGAVMVTLVNFLLPFAILPVFAALRNVPMEAIEAARDLGASPSVALFRVIVPQCRTGLFSAFAFTFLLAAGDYVTPIFLGGPAGSMLGQFIAQEFSVRFNWPAGAAMSFGLLASSLIVLALAWGALPSGRRLR